MIFESIRHRLIELREANRFDKTIGNQIAHLISFNLYQSSPTPAETSPASKMYRILKRISITANDDMVT